MKNYIDSKIAFIHGRPGPHPSHAALAKSVNADFYLVDRILRYHDLENTSRVRRYASWLLNSVFFPKIKEYDLFISEGSHLPPVIMKRLGLLKKEQKIATMMGNEMIFFLKANQYSKSSHDAILNNLFRYDALICLSQMQADIAEDLIKGKKSKTKIYVAHEVIKPDRFEKFGHISSSLIGKRMLFIGSGPAGWRGFYKGFKTLLETFDIVAEKYQDATLTVVGDWDEEYVYQHLQAIRYGKERISFISSQKNLIPFFENSDLYIHLSNGDAFPLTTLEAMRAGLPIIVSEWTGTKEVVIQIDPRLVVQMNPAAAAERVEWYFNLSLEEKRKMSNKAREATLNFSEEKCFEEFRGAVDKVLNQ